MSCFNPQIVIIGAGGFLGQALFSYLSIDSSDLLCVSRSFQWNPNKEVNLCTSKFVKSKVEDVENYSHLIKDNAVVIYMAGSTNLTLCQENPAEDLSNHVSALTLFLKSIRHVKINRFVFISSAGTIYGEALGKPSGEDDVCRPKSIYGLRNKILEDIVSGICSNYSTNFLILRIANPISVNQISLRRRGLVMSLISSCYNNEMIRIRGRGMQYRDYISSRDFSEFVYHSLHMPECSIPTTLNICSGKSFNSHQVIQLISSAIDKKPNVQFIDECYPSDVTESRISNKVLTQVLLTIGKPHLFCPLDQFIDQILHDLKDTGSSYIC